MTPCGNVACIFPEEERCLLPQGHPGPHQWMTRRWFSEETGPNSATITYLPDAEHRIEPEEWRNS